MISKSKLFFLENIRPYFDRVILSNDCPLTGATNHTFCPHVIQVTALEVNSQILKKVYSGPVPLTLTVIKH